MIGIAFAQEGGAAPQGGLGALGSFVPILLMIGIFYFLLIRPQQKKEKERKEMISAIREGDRVLTVGGIYAVVAGFKDDNTVFLKIGQNTKVEFAKTAIQAKVP